MILAGLLHSRVNWVAARWQTPMLVIILSRDVPQPRRCRCRARRANTNRCALSPSVSLTYCVEPSAPQNHDGLGFFCSGICNTKLAPHPPSPPPPPAHNPHAGTRPHLVCGSCHSLQLGHTHGQAIFGYSTRRRRHECSGIAHLGDAFHY